jgi:hypothetical protein
MESNELKFTVENGVKELVILSGSADPIYHEKGIDVKGASIDSAYEYLSKKVVDPDKIQHSKIHFSYEGLYINLYYAARDRNCDMIEGSLKLHPDLLKFSINTNKTYNTFELADFIKMNRHYFENKEYAMKLVSELRGFEGKVNREIEAKADTRANQKMLINQTVESNIPAGFILVLPVFVGQEKVRLEVEISITADFSCSLISPDLKQLVDEETKKILDAELEKIKKLHPELKIFQF